MKIVSRREIPGLAVNYLADLGGAGRAPGPARLAEFVDTLEPGIPKAEKWVMMISTQFGCPVGCSMCDGGLLGFHGNLTADQMLAQVRRIAAGNPALDIGTHPKVKIHFARMGEPSLNPAVLDALELLGREYPHQGVMPSLSTVAPKSRATAPFFDRLIEVKDRHFGGGRFQLQFSLHAVDSGSRRGVIPIPTWSLDEVAAYGRRFVRPGDRRITLNFALGPGGTIDAAALAAAFDPALFLVKVTPINPTKAAEASGSANVWMQAPPSVQSPADELVRRGFRVILSPSAQEEIEAETSCGQLWSGEFKTAADVALANRRRERRSYVRPSTLPARAAAWLGEARKTGRREFPLEPGSAALLVVDMQEFFLSRRSPAYAPQARAVLPNVRALVEAFRRAGRPALFTLHAHEDPARDGGLMTWWWDKACLAGTPEASVSPVLEPARGEVLRKCRYSAFTNPSLERRLRRSGVSQLVVAGVMTNLCVESTVRDAFDLGFKTFVVADATAAHTEELHVGSLRSMAQGFSAVRLTAALARETVEAERARADEDVAPCLQGGTQ
ncbi:MAG: isochorismatase family protein [Elusimicrobia bacterium]|nr:isochorismatase family protein [Elusimicrobiota bacterium]